MDNGKNVSRGTQSQTQMGAKLGEAMSRVKKWGGETQYGNHQGMDAQECLEACNPHSTIGINKGDRNRGGK